MVWYEFIIWNHGFGIWLKPLLENGLFMLWLNTMKFWMKFGVNLWCDGMNSNLEIYVLNSYTNFMYELIMWTKWTKDREGEQEVCPYKRKVEQELLELLAD